MKKVVKKYSIFIPIILILAFVYIICGKIEVTEALTYSNGGWDPSTSEFVNTADTTVRTLSFSDGGSDYLLSHDATDDCYQSYCWSHQTGSGSPALNIYAVYTGTYDEDEHSMVIVSISDGNTNHKTVSAYGNSSVAALLGKMELTHNTQEVKLALSKCYNEGEVRYSPAIDDSNNYGGAGVNSNGHNSSSTNASSYESFLALHKSTSTNPAESTTTITKNSTEYTVIGPFSIKYDGEDIKNIVVNGTTYVPGDTTDGNYIYIYQGDSASSTASDYGKAASKFKTSDIKGGKKFYLAVPTSILPDEGTYKVKITQDEFTYYKSRACTTSASGSQDYGIYDWIKTKKKVNADEEWTITANRGKTLILRKGDMNGSTNGNTGNFTGAKFVIYAKDTTFSSNSGSGWLNGDADDTKTLKSSVSNATEYTLSSATLEIKKLKPGTYYIYEVGAPTSSTYYPLYAQKRYMKVSASDTYESAFKSNTRYTEWVYIGYVKLKSSGDSTINDNADARQIISVSTSGSTTTLKVGNYRAGILQITKTDKMSGTDLSGAKFMVYCVSSITNATGWLAGDYDGLKTYGTFDNGTEYYKHNLYYLAYGTYYIYEISAPTKTSDGDSVNYDLRNQSGYMSTGNCTAAETDLSNSGTEYVYCGSSSVTESNTTSSTKIVKNATNYESGELTIEKKGYSTGNYLSGSEFIIYAETNTPSGTNYQGWLSGNATATKSYVEFSSKATYSVSQTLTITKLLYGKYYIYEITAPTGCDLRNQSGYMSTGNCAAAETDLSNSGIEYVYCGSSSITKNNIEVLKSITNYESGELTIEKKDYDTGSYLSGAEFIIYAETDTPSGINYQGWLSGDATATKSYVAFSSKSTYSVSQTLTITKLLYGKYYIYEITAPTDYDLRNQSGYMSTGNCVAAEKDLTDNGIEYVYCGSSSITKNNIEVLKSITNYESGELTIEKQDLDTKEYLSGAEFIIYAETNTPSGVNYQGWLSGSETETKSYVEYSNKKIYTVNETLTITKLLYGTYYIYEITTPTGYFLENQENYMKTGINSSAEQDLSNAGIEYVYCGSVNLKIGDHEKTLTVLNEFFANVTIIKKDSSTGDLIEGMGFKIYNNTNGKYLCWDSSGEAIGTDRDHTQEAVGQTTDASKASIFYTDSNGEIYIEHIDVGSLQLIADRSFTISEADSKNLYYQTDTTITEEVKITDLASALFEVTFENTKAYSLSLCKKDRDNSSVEVTAKFYIQYFIPSGESDSVWAENDGKWLTQDGEYSSTESSVEVSTAGITINDIQRGTYVVYEYEAPTGYDITQQYNYNSSTGYVECGTITVGDDSSGTIVNNCETSGDTSTLLDTIDDNGYKVVTMTIYNRKWVRHIGGFVWVDNQTGKLNVYNYTYDEDEELVSDIMVELYHINGTSGDEVIAREYTDSNGAYEFTLYRQVLYWDLYEYYISFEYNNETYVAVDPFVGDDYYVNSKAQEWSMTEDELDDTNLLDGVDDGNNGQGNSNPGYAITNKETTSLEDEQCLANYYNESNYTIEAVNLGLLIKADPTYSIEETLSYAYITINGFTYIYYYDTPSGTTVYDNYEDVPDVVKQQDAHTYSMANQVSVYSSDIASTNAGESDMQLYLVYSIYVYNSETLSDDDIYNEQKLYLSSLTDTYDTDRLSLSTDNSGNSQYTGSEQFGMWSGSNGTASYALFDGSSANEDSVYKNGINPGQTIKTYIQFKVTSTSLTELLTGDLSKNSNEATTANATGFHEYLRTDNLWHDDLSETEYAADFAKYPRNETYATQNSNGDIYYIHKSVEKEATSGALYVAIITTTDTGEERTVTAIVYEDDAEESSYNYNGTDYTTYVGNGKIDDTEGTRAEGVKVELLKVNTTSSVSLQSLEQATLYVQDTNESSGYKTSKAETTTDSEGKYSFEGVIPGYYYIRFTYGDGTQKLINVDGTEVDLTSVDYKSTIINTTEAGSILQNAMEASWTNYDSTTLQTSAESSLENYYETGNVDEESMKLLEWYKYLGTTDFNTATDDLNLKELYDGYTYTEKGIYDASGTLIIEYEYDSDGNLIKITDTVTGNTIATYDSSTGELTYTYAEGNSYPINIQSYTPEMAISIENTELNYTENEDEHVNVYDEFDFGIVKSPETNTEVTKSIIDVGLTVQQGSTLISGIDSTYVTVLDQYQQYLGVEIDADSIYGSSLEVTYSVEVENVSQADYIEENEDEYGTYYKYGTITSSATTKSIEINEVIDDVDSKYIVTKLDGTTTSQTLTSGSTSTVYSDSITINKLDTSDSTLGDNSTTTSSSITFTGWESITIGESLSIVYTVNSWLNSTEDTLYTNPARVTSISLNDLTTLTSSYEWGERSWAEISVYPKTGGDMRNVLYVAGAIALIAVAFGIILIKKKII